DTTQAAAPSTDEKGAAAPLSIRWRSGEALAERKTSDAVAADLATLTAGKDRRIVVQLDQPVTDPLRAQLDASGVKLLNYLGDNAFFATLAPAGVNAAALAQTPGLVRAEAIGVQRKTHPLFLGGVAPAYAVVDATSTGTIVAAYVVFHPDVPLV